MRSLYFERLRGHLKTGSNIVSVSPSASSSVPENHAAVRYLAFLQSVKRELIGSLVVDPPGVSSVGGRCVRCVTQALCGVVWRFLLSPGAVVGGSGGSGCFQVTCSCVGGWAAGSVGSACSAEMPTPRLPVNAGNVSSRLIMRYTSRAVCLQVPTTPLGIDRAPIQISEVMYLQTCLLSEMLESVYVLIGMLAVFSQGKRLQVQFCISEGCMFVKSAEREREKEL